MSENNASDFWSELPIVLSEAEQLDDNEAADRLIVFLELHRETWTAIAASMLVSSGRRALFERACLVLAERQADERFSS